MFNLFPTVGSGCHRHRCVLGGGLQFRTRSGVPHGECICGVGTDRTLSLALCPHRGEGWRREEMPAGGALSFSLFLLLSSLFLSLLFSLPPSFFYPSLSRSFFILVSYCLNHLLLSYYSFCLTLSISPLRSIFTPL